MTSIKGTLHDEWLVATAKNDELYGYEGNDTLLGGAGNDRLYADAVPRPAPGGGTFLTQGQPGYNVLKGGGGEDTLAGGSGRDWLYGGPGDDYLYLLHDGTGFLNGQRGNDTLLWEDSAIRLIGRRSRER